MNSSLILCSVTRLVFWPMIFLSALFYFRGHQLPGGGFVGGLLAASAFSLWGFAFGVAKMRKRLKIEPVSWMAIGLLLAYGSGLIAGLNGMQFMTGTWSGEVALIGQVGSPMLFDLGVYCVVVGMVVLIVTELLERGT